MRKNTPETIWGRVNKTDSCWIWTGAATRGGYGCFTLGNKPYLAHRWSYVQTHGEIPEGKEIDHMCGVTRCMNPDHLEAVTHQENLMRGQTTCAAHAVKTECPSGHPYSGSNLYLWKGIRQCRTCRKIRAATRYAALRSSP